MAFQYVLQFSQLLSIQAPQRSYGWPAHMRKENRWTEHVHTADLAEFIDAAFSERCCDYQILFADFNQRILIKLVQMPEKGATQNST